ncbi:MAG TPA: hypothetical protein VF155_06085 [Candidatus Dormibacteraeota bacterium]
MIVVVTIHGIGFQNHPSGLQASDGYADNLHAGLCATPQLTGGVLGDDPNRLAAGGHGPVYVASAYPYNSNSTEAGLKRLGTWAGRDVDPTGMPLAPDGARFAHVALVYSQLEETHGDAVAALDVGLMGAPALTHYATIGGIARMAFEDLRAINLHPGASTPSQQVRAQAHQHRGFFSRLLHRAQPADGQQPAGGPLGALRTIEDDVAAYVVRNELRERVRAFIRDAVSRILARPGIDGVIVNGHSNGTVMGFDLISALSPPSAAHVRLLITSGCPLRKYVDFMDWGIDAHSFFFMPQQHWTNFYDKVDPVADPLQPPVTWKRGQALPDGGGPGLFVVYDPNSGAESHVAVRDVVVDNIAAGVGGGLPAHNYWDNADFCRQAAALIASA